MNPERSLTTERGFAMIGPSDGMSEYDRELQNAGQYFGSDYPGNPGLTCLKCGAVVNLGWQHIEWHEAQEEDKR